MKTRTLLFTLLAGIGGLMPVAARANEGRRLDVTVVAETFSPAAAPAPTAERPVYYVLHDAGLVDRGDPIGNNKPPAPGAVAQALVRDLATAGFRPASAAQPPTLVLVTHWGNLRRDTMELTSLFEIPRSVRARLRLAAPQAMAQKIETDLTDRKTAWMMPGFIDDAKNNLGGWTVVESSEAGMLTEAEKAIKNNEWIVFLGWTPHPVMGDMKLHYLSGVEAAGFGSATVYTNTRAGWAAECPNAAKLVSNMKFTLPMVGGSIMAPVLKDGKDPKAVAAEWIKGNADTVAAWLDGVTTIDGGDAKAAIMK